MPRIACLSSKGNAIDLQNQRWRRRALLAALGGVHVLAFMMWRAPEYLRPQPGLRQTDITWLLPARPAAMPSAVARPTPRASAMPPERGVPVPAVPRPESQAVHLPPAAPAATAEPLQAVQSQPITVPAADPFALPDKRKEGLLQQSLKSAGVVDRQLRKESWNPRDKHIVSAQAEEAGRGTRAGTTFETFELPDGRKMAKVRLPNGGSYCAAMESNALTGGRDPFRDGVKTKASTCPR